MWILTQHCKSTITNFLKNMIPLTNPIEGISPRVSSTVNYGISVIRCIKAGPVIVTNVPVWYRMLIAGEALHLGSRGFIVTVFSAQLLCEPKTALKLKFKKFPEYKFDTK